MKKKALIIVLFCLGLAFPWPVWGSLYYFSGTMDASFEITHEIDITLPSGLAEFQYIFTLPEDYTLPTNTQDATEVVFSYTGETPSEYNYPDTYGNHYTLLTWTNPAAGAITITATYTVAAGADWDGFVTRDLFPFNSTGLPASITTFLEPTDNVQSDDSAIMALASSLTSGITTQWEAVLAINGWVMTNITYGSNSSGTDALSTYNLLTGVCSNYSHLATALLRAAGIPARLASGYALSKPYSIEPDGGYLSTDWGQGSHAWIEVYYPSLGWVPYDPQRDLHHVDTHRYLESTGPDLDAIDGGWSWSYSYPPSSYPSVSSTVSVNWVSDVISLSHIKTTNEITDFSLSTDVTFIQIPDYTITASAGSGGSISPEGEVTVTEGESQGFSITPDSWYNISDVLVDGVSQGAVSAYIFSNVTGDHTIAAQFQAADDDEDNLPDWWEQQIIDHDTNDEITGIDDVLPGDDFDGDGFLNINEYQKDTDPTDAGSHPLKAMPWLIILLDG